MAEIAKRSDSAVVGSKWRPGNIRALLRTLDSSLILWVAVAAILVLIVANPLLRLVATSFQDADGAGFTFANYLAAYGHPRYLTALWHSVALGFAVSALCIVFAVPMAWAVARTDMPGKQWVRVLVLGTFTMPSYLGSITWVLLAGPNAGWLNRFVTALTGTHTGVFNIYSFGGLAFVMALYSFPYMFIFTTSALKVVSSEMEDAANILGSGLWRTTFKVTLPLVLPAIIAGFIVTFLESIALFGTPAIIAMPWGYNVVATQLWQFFSFPPIQVQVAAAYAMPLLLLTIGLFWMQRRIVSRKGFVSVTGKGGELRMAQLGRLRWVAFGYCMVVLSFSVILPYLALAQAAFAKGWGRGIHWNNWTLDNFKFVLFFPDVQNALLHSFSYAAGAAFIAIGLALVVAYVVHRRLLPFADVLSFMCMAPFVIPGIVLAIGFYAAYTSPPLSLYGTAAILIVAFATRFLPIAYANSSAAIRAINPEMEDAVRILGAGRLTAVRRVVAPLLKQGLVGAWLLVFIPAMRELSTAMFLYVPQTRIISVMLFDMSEEGNFEHLCALGLVLLVATLVVVLIGYRLVGRDFMLRRG
jgi:iron(III) transport system permease protein